MTKKIFAFFIASILVASFNLKASNLDNDHTFLNELTTQLDSLNLEDGQKLLLEEYNHFIFLLDFIKETSEPREYTEDEEQENKVESIKTSLPPQMFTKESIDRNISIAHRFADPIEDIYYNHKPQLDSTDLLTSFLIISNDLEEANKYLTYSYTLDSIYYKDGSSKKEYKEIDRFLSMDNLKQIDKVVLTVNYPTSLNTVIISNKDKTAQLNNVSISLDSIDKNIVRFYISGEGADAYITTQGKTKSGYVVDFVQANSSTISQEDSEKMRSSIEKYLGEIINKIEAEKYKSKEALISDLKENSKYIYIPNEDKKQYITANYKGNVDEVYLYFASNNKEKGQIQITVPVKEELKKYNLRVNDLDKATMVIIDENNQIVARIPDEYRAYQLNNDYYSLIKENDEYSDLYKLDLNKGLTKVEKNPAYEYNINRSLSDDLLLIRTPKNSYKNGAIDKNGNIVIPVEYNYLEKSDTEDLIIGSNGSSMSDDSNYALYDLSGKKIASGEGYISISKFEDGLASIQKDNKIGYIDNRGKLVIPFIYEPFSSDFENGIALVENKEGERALINKKNEAIVPFTKYNYVSTSRNEQGRIYILGDKKYDSKGNLIK